MCWPSPKMRSDAAASVVTSLLPHCGVFLQKCVCVSNSTMGFGAHCPDTIPSFHRGDWTAAADRPMCWLPPRSLVVVYPEQAFKCDGTLTEDRVMRAMLMILAFGFALFAVRAVIFADCVTPHC